MGIQVFPNLVEQSMRPELKIVRRANAIVSLNVADVSSTNPEEAYYEDKLGCARGVVFAVAFQAALVVLVAVCWKLFVH
jgi:hypothetical protein